ncbi:MAG: trypsin-like peptidase domain-containing protein [Kineosporiaceae bacterium]
MTQHPDHGWARPSTTDGSPSFGDQPAGPATGVGSPPPLPQTAPVPLPPPPGYGAAPTEPVPTAPTVPVPTVPVPTVPVPTVPVPGGPATPDLDLLARVAAGGARRRMTGARLFAAATAVLLLGVLGGAAGVWLMARTGTLGTVGVDQGTSSGRVVPAPAITRPANSVAAVASAVLTSTVQIMVSGSQGEGSGSGFVMDSQGHVLTNNHVVSAVTNPKLTVVFDDGTHKSATVVGKDASYDLAVLKVDTGSRPALTFGDSDRVAVGDPVIAIGAPLGLQGTVTTGIVSAKNRPVSAGESASDASYINAIQTDAAINPGNSGGPLVDATGAVIGINSAIARAPGSVGPSGGNIGLGFAIPSNQARRIAAMLITKGKADYPIIGVSLDSTYDGEGVRVLERPEGTTQPVQAGGPADKAGIKAGDVIVAIDGRPVTSSVELIVAIRAKAVGDTVQLTVRRGGSERTVTVTLVAAGR